MFNVVSTDNIFFSSYCTVAYYYITWHEASVEYKSYNYTRSHAFLTYTTDTLYVYIAQFVLKLWLHVQNNTSQH